MAAHQSLFFLQKKKMRTCPRYRLCRSKNQKEKNIKRGGFPPFFSLLLCVSYHLQDSFLKLAFAGKGKRKEEREGKKSPLSLSLFSNFLVYLHYSTWPEASNLGDLMRL